MIRAFDAVSLPLLRWFDPEDAHRLAIQGLRLLPPIRPRPDDPKLAVRAFGLNFPNPDRHGRRFRQERRSSRCAVAGRVSLVEIGSVTPAASRQSAAAAIPASRREVAINRMGFNNDGADAVLRRLAARASRRHRRRQCRGQQGYRRSRRRLCEADRDLRAGGELFSPSTCRRRTRRACATCNRRRRSTISRPR